MGYDFLKFLCVDFKGVMEIVKIDAVKIFIEKIPPAVDGWQPPSIII